MHLKNSHGNIFAKLILKLIFKIMSLRVHLNNKNKYLRMHLNKDIVLNVVNSFDIKKFYTI